MKRMQTRLKYFHFTRCRTFENCIERKRYLQAFYQISTYVATKIGGEQKNKNKCYMQRLLARPAQHKNELRQVNRQNYRPWPRLCSTQLYMKIRTQDKG